MSRIQRSMTRAYHWLGPLAMVLVFACGGVADGETELEPADIGKLEQALFLFNDYGMEQNGTQQPCRQPYAGGICAVPSTKTPLYAIAAHDALGCWGQFWTDAMQSAVNGINAWNQSFQTDFQFVQAGSTQQAKVSIMCDATQNGDGPQHMAAAIPTAWTCSCVNGGTPYVCGDMICKVTKMEIRLWGNNIIDAYIATGASPTQLQRKIDNLARHELGHAMGLAHSPLGMQAGKLMAGATNNYVLSDPKWNQLLSPTSTEASLVWGYCPGGNTAGCE